MLLANNFNNCQSSTPVLFCLVISVPCKTNPVFLNYTLFFLFPQTRLKHNGKRETLGKNWAWMRHRDGLDGIPYCQNNYDWFTSILTRIIEMDPLHWWSLLRSMMETCVFVCASANDRSSFYLNEGAVWPCDIKRKGSICKQCNKQDIVNVDIHFW